ncbi:hypothetical protein [Lacticaseibacillus camelliae]|uniref:Integral membrane protein n=1 Tax=Lacticaseibacillus camelliae DSM 22697 = JCM 13995 TaxID=1423730 RepID=A0A0R2F0P8_9LACO|nr:hypothetical protein [Lacticaseibacillus camelliae]KRN22210.1 hypothetical protein FC75_GL001846 [Lacticaseibacillus camelliae DSM 22697 = JCM 13995]
MSKVKAWLKTPSAMIILLSVIATMVLPWGFTLLHVHVAVRVLILWIIINMGLCLWFGRLMSKHHLQWWLTLVLPALFALMVFIRFANYGYWFVPVYWLLTMLAWTRD